ncbi:murein biosynthesis integral membrane protein MurJ [soil metagenome]
MTSEPAQPLTTPAKEDDPAAGKPDPAIVMPSFARSASIVGLAFVASRVLGLIREIVMANRFGTSSEYDAYISAFRIPDLLFLVVMSGAFGSAIIPIFGSFLARGDRESANRLASSVITYTAVVTVALGALAFVFAGPLMRSVVAPDLPPGAMDLAVRTMRYLLVSPLLLGLGIAAKGILEAQNKFVLPALAPLLYNLSIVVAAIVLAPDHGIDGVTAGVIIGAMLHVSIQIPGLVASGLRFRPSLSRNVAGLGDVGALLLPRVVGQAAFQINFVAVNAFASSAGEGRVSGLNYAWQLMMLPHGVLALSISTVLFPTMAQQFELGQIQQMKATLLRALKPLLFLIIPASIGLYEFGYSIFQTIFQTGSFTSESTRLAAEPLALLAAGLVFYGLVEVLARTFYAMKDTRTPVIAGIVIIVMNIAISAAVVDRLGHVGLAMALSISTMIEALILLAVLRVRIGGFGPSFGAWLVRVIAATAVMAAAAEMVRPRLEELTIPGATNRFVQVMQLGIAVSLVAAVYFAAAWFFRIPETTRAISAVDRRLHRLTHRSR